jgi:8-oxo-dGTP pyrophosphatase MutT (NUDIX family)
MDRSTGAGQAPVVDAATVVLVREVGAGLECLMLRKNAGQTFGGLWVFPGGKLEPEEGAGEAGARRAAVREAFEETGLVLDGEALVPFAHWLPPPEAPRRFATWFFVAALPDGAGDVVIDGGEIGDQMWTTAEGALALHRAGEVGLAPPTWMTLRWLSDAGSVEAALATARAGDVEHFSTHIYDDDGVLVAVWAPDAAYDSGDLAHPGARYRLRMETGGWVLERS